MPLHHQTEIAAKTAELGGVHKYDLTPDCTHLIVGEYDTPKYRHVAKERPDVKPMVAGWIEAVRDLWVEDAEIDFFALEREWQLRTFETSGGEPATVGGPPVRRPLLCCMTGFEDPDERQRIIDQIEANGGVYTGDLTRRVSHLVVYKAEGRKYQAARNWNVRTVSVEWVDDSVARGMILDEKCYDPALPKDKRGVGAWNKKEITRRIPLGKRSREGSVAGQDEGKRKLRRTASMKLNSQRDNIWGDILGKPQAAEPAPVAPEAAPAPPPAESFARSNGTHQSSRSMDTQGTRLASFGTSEDGIVFASCGFYVHGFSQQKTEVVVNAVASLGGLVCHSLDEVVAASGAQLAHRFLVVPQTSAADTHPKVPENVHIITQFYIERCMHKKYFFNPSEHVFGRPFPVFPIPGLEELTICTAGFTGVDLNHMDKALRQLGAKYEERFTADVSMLVCASLSTVRADKLRLARAWRVPVVKVDWLWECISTGCNVPLKDFLFPELKQSLGRDEGAWVDDEKAKRRPDRSARETVDKDLLPQPAAAKGRGRRGMDSSGFSPMPADGSGAVDMKKPAAADRRPARADESMTTATTHFETAPTHQHQTDSGSSTETSGSGTGASAPLSETSANALNRTSQSPRKLEPRKPLARIASEIADSEATDGELGHSSNIPAEPENEEPQQPQRAPEREDTGDAKRRSAAEKAALAAAERHAISTKLAFSILDSAVLEPISAGGSFRSGVAGVADAGSARGAPRRRRRQVFGRAVSNVSAASSASGECSAGVSASGGGAAQPGSTNELPSGTQIQYDDPEASAAKAKLMQKLLGPKGHAPAVRRQEKLTFGDMGGYDMDLQEELARGERRSKRR